MQPRSHAAGKNMHMTCVPMVCDGRMVSNGLATKLTQDVGVLRGNIKIIAIYRNYSVLENALRRPTSTEKKKKKVFMHVFIY